MTSPNVHGAIRAAIESGHSSRDEITDRVAMETGCKQSYVRAAICGLLKKQRKQFRTGVETPMTG